MANQPFYTTLDWKRRQPLKLRTGAEPVDSIVLASGSVTANANGQKLVPAGQLLCKITSGDDTGKYGPYLKTASDGTETLAVGNARVAVEGHDLAFGDEPGGGYFALAEFDLSELTLSGVSTHGSPLTSLKAAFPTCTFLD